MYLYWSNAVCCPFASSVEIECDSARQSARVEQGYDAGFSPSALERSCIKGDGMA
jgi:hypothetical protein